MLAQFFFGSNFRVDFSLSVRRFNLPEDNSPSMMRKDLETSSPLSGTL
jgi:hypothetical protein